MQPTKHAQQKLAQNLGTVRGSKNPNKTGDQVPPSFYLDPQPVPTSAPISKSQTQRKIQKAPAPPSRTKATESPTAGKEGESDLPLPMHTWTIEQVGQWLGSLGTKAEGTTKTEEAAADIKSLRVNNVDGKDLVGANVDFLMSKGLKKAKALVLVKKIKLYVAERKKEYESKKAALEKAAAKGALKFRTKRALFVSEESLPTKNKEGVKYEKASDGNLTVDKHFDGLSPDPHKFPAEAWGCGTDDPEAGHIALRQESLFEISDWRQESYNFGGEPFKKVRVRVDIPKVSVEKEMLTMILVMMLVMSFQVG